MKSLPLFVILVTLSSSAYAEHGCQDGFIPVNQGGQQVCVADYNLPYWNNQDSSDPVVPAGPKWEDRWGAIATDASNGGVGTAANRSSKREAEKAALTSCRSKGGNKCKISLAYYNQCGAMAWGDSYAVTRGAGTLQEASEDAMKICGENTKNCSIYYGECSLPERIQ